MEVPETIRLQLTSTSVDRLDGVLVMLATTGGKVRPGKFVFPKTDAAGRAVLTRAEILGQFEDLLEVGHGGSIRDLHSIVTVMLYNPRALIDDKNAVVSMPMRGHEKTKWPDREAWFADRTSCRNPEIRAANKLVNLALTQTIVYEVEPRPESIVP